MYSKSKLELNSKIVELEWCKNVFVSVYILLFCTDSQTSWVLSN